MRFVQIKDYELSLIFSRQKYQNLELRVRSHANHWGLHSSIYGSALKKTLIIEYLSFCSEILHKMSFFQEGRYYRDLSLVEGFVPMRNIKSRTSGVLQIFI